LSRRELSKRTWRQSTGSADKLYSTKKQGKSQGTKNTSKEGKKGSNYTIGAREIQKGQPKNHSQ